MAEARQLAIQAAVSKPDFRIGSVEVSRDALGRIHDVVRSDVLFVPTGTRPPAAADRFVFRGMMSSITVPGGVFYVRSDDVVRPHLHCWSLSVDDLAALHELAVLEAGMPPRLRRDPVDGAIASGTLRLRASLALDDAKHLQVWLTEAFPAAGRARLPVAARSAWTLGLLCTRIRDTIAGTRGTSAAVGATSIELDAAEIAAIHEADAAAHGYSGFGAFGASRAGVDRGEPCASCVRIAASLLHQFEGVVS